jgi:hypothetical protein
VIVSLWFCSDNGARLPCGLCRSISRVWRNLGTMKSLGFKPSGSPRIPTTKPSSRKSLVFKGAMVLRLCGGVRCCVMCCDVPAIPVGLSLLVRFGERV